MAWYEDASYGDRLIRCEKKAAEIRKLLFGSILLAKDIWKDELEQKPAGIEILKAIEGLKENFVNNSLTDRFEKLEDLLDVLNKRAKGIFLLMEYISKNKQDK